MSQSLLRNFTLRKQLLTHDNKHQSFRLAGTRSAFYLAFDTYAPFRSEELWATIENAIPEMNRAIERRKAIGDSGVERIIRDVLALHWARSAAIKEMHEALSFDVMRKHAEIMSQQPEILKYGMLSITGLHPGGQGGLDWFNAAIHEEVRSSGVEQWLSDRNEHHLNEARRILSKAPVQVAYTPIGSDFMISDVPVVTVRPNHDGLGPHQGVALDEANSISMPVSPGAAIGLGETPKQGTLRADQVATLNQRQIGARIRWIACRPSSLSERELRAKLPDNPRAAH